MPDGVALSSETVVLFSVMDDPKTIAGRVVVRKDAGWTAKQIALEEKITVGRVKEIIRRANSSTRDSRLIIETHEMCLEMLAVLRCLIADPEKIAKRMRGLEKRDLPRRVGEAIMRTPS